MSGKKSKRQPTASNSKSEIRRKILEAFRNSPKQTFNYKRISKKLNIKKEVIKKLVAIIMDELEESGELIKIDRGAFKLNFKQTVIEGRIDMANKGAGYLVCEGMEEDVFIPPNSMNRALHGDIVKAGLVIRKEGRRREAEVLEVLKRAKTDFVGTVQLHESFAFVVVDDKKMSSDIFIPGREMGKVISGEKVIARLTDWPEDSNNPIGTIIDILGMAGDNDVEMHSILAEFGLPYKFEDNILKQADEIPGEITPQEIKKRRDMRKAVTFTIDPDDAKDFDDAISVEKLKDGLWEIGVHIADVSHYIKEGSLLDKEAYERATSVYLVDRVVPMLPERLSNDLCSLNAHTDKLCFSAVFKMIKDTTTKRVVASCLYLMLLNQVPRNPSLTQSRSSSKIVRWLHWRPASGLACCRNSGVSWPVLRPQVSIIITGAGFYRRASTNANTTMILPPGSGMVSMMLFWLNGLRLLIPIIFLISNRCARRSLN